MFRYRLLAPTVPIVTVSAGLTIIYPSKESSEKELITAADLLLYTAKENGKNQVGCTHERVNAASDSAQTVGQKFRNIHLEADFTSSRRTGIKANAKAPEPPGCRKENRGDDNG